jgi:hypothetical protein
LSEAQAPLTSALARHRAAVHEKGCPVPKKPNPKPETVLFNVVYEDGTLSSNRRVPANLLAELDSKAQIQAFLEQQDREIAERSGRSRGAIDRIERVR